MIILTSDEDFSLIYEVICEHLSWVDDKLVDDLSSFIENKMNEDAIITKDGKKILIGFSVKPTQNKRNVKTFLKKFLHKNDLKDKLRIISTSKNQYTIHKLPGIWTVFCHHPPAGIGWLFSALHISLTSVYAHRYTTG